MPSEIYISIFFLIPSSKFFLLLGLRRSDMPARLQNIEREGLGGKVSRNKELARVSTPAAPVDGLEDGSRTVPV
jgi:hypothetical protein